MKRIPWRKVPTVLTGGKPFFYVRHVGTLKQSIAWARYADGHGHGTWTYSENNILLITNDSLAVLKKEADKRKEKRQ